MNKKWIYIIFNLVKEYGGLLWVVAVSITSCMFYGMFIFQIKDPDYIFWTFILSATFGLLGLATVLMPFVLLSEALDYLKNKHNENQKNKYLACDGKYKEFLTLCQKDERQKMKDDLHCLSGHYFK